MRFEPNQAFAEAEPLFGLGQRQEGADELPPEIAFLQTYHDEPAVLYRAANAARREGVCAARALIAEEGVSAALYYRALATHLQRPFVDKWPLIAPPHDLGTIYRSETVRMACAASPTWLVAPTGRNLRTMLAAQRLGIALPDIAITTPSHLSAIVQYRSQDAVEDTATEELNLKAPQLSAKGAASRFVGVVCLIAALLSVVGVFFMPTFASDIAGLLFLAGIAFRFIVCIAGLGPAARSTAPQAETDLPFYTVLVPLHDEGRIVPTLVANLCALDYPKSKLEILMLVEPEDAPTRAALASSRLPPHFRVVVAPSKAGLRTKPRALNIGLTMARGSLLTVYDAEDQPEPDQLRRAAALFAESPDTLACLQARLAMCNGADGLLPELFAIEYAALFDLYNIGTCKLGLPLALGGTSNHFRVSALRASGGWDAWNVTEDADLGLRLSRFGYQVASLDSTTMETAPTKLAVWMKQRRRWTKGWIQTFLVLARDGRTVCTEIGWKRSIVLVAMLVNLVVGPLLLPVFSALVLWHLVAGGIPQPKSTIAFLELILNLAVFSTGVGVALWSAYAGLKARRLDQSFFRLPLVLPYQLMVSAAAWMGLWDLAMRPHHWHKTPH